MQAHRKPVWVICLRDGTECGSANKRSWGSLKRWCEWVRANSCIKVIQEIWNRPVRSNSRNDPTLVHWIYRSPWYRGSFSPPPPDKGEGAVRPIVIGEVIRRITGKCVVHVTKPDVIDTCGSLQVCAGHKSGSEAAIYTMPNIFEADETNAVLLIDASNAFNVLNRAAALHNIQVLSPTLADLRDKHQ